jgi:hypothetical protein
MEFTTIGRYFKPLDATLAAARLEAAGLHPVVRDEAAALSVEGYALSVGGVRLQVPAAEAAEATRFLAEAAGEG